MPLPYQRRLSSAAAPGGLFTSRQRLFLSSFFHGYDPAVVYLDSPQVEEADRGVEQDVGGMVAERFQLVDEVVEPEGQHRERPVGFVTLLLQIQSKQSRQSSAV